MTSRCSFQSQGSSGRESRRNRLFLKTHLLMWAYSKEARSGLWRNKSAHQCMWQLGKKETRTETEELQVLVSTSLQSHPLRFCSASQDRRAEPRNNASSLWPQPPSKQIGTASATGIFQAFHANDPLTLMAKAIDTKPLRTTCRTCHASLHTRKTF